MYRTLNYLWSLSLTDLQEICRAVGLVEFGTRGQLIKMLVDNYSLDKIELLIPKKTNKSIVVGAKEITTKCTTCGNA